MIKPILVVTSRFTKAIEERLDRDYSAPRKAVAIVMSCGTFDRRYDDSRLSSSVSRTSYEFCGPRSRNPR
jgi:hypothetical protein